MQRTHFGPRNLKACQRCFKRKIKCIKNDTDKKCTYCTKKGYHCEKRKLIDIYYTKSTHVPAFQRNFKAFEALSNSVQFFEFVCQGLEATFSIDAGKIEIPELNINESFLDYSFLKRPQSMGALFALDFPDEATGFALFEQAKTVISYDTQVMLHKSTADFLKKVYEPSHIVNVSDDETRLELLRIFGIFAIGRLHTTGEVVPEEYPGLGYFKIALHLMTDIYDNPSISYIECIIILTLYLVGLNKLNYAYMYSGMSLRLSILIKLDDPRTYLRRDISELQKERMRRLWCTVRSMDFYMSGCLGCQPQTKFDQVFEYPSDQTYGDELPTGLFIRERARLGELKYRILSVILETGDPKIQDVLDQFHERSQAIAYAFSELSHQFEQTIFRRLAFALVFRLNECIILATLPGFLQELRPESLQLLKLSDSSNISTTCIIAAISNLRTYEFLFKKANISLFGFIDTNFLFLSSIILLLARYLWSRKPQNIDIEEAWDDCMTLFGELTKTGNVTANEYLNKIMHLRNLLSILEKHIKPMESLSEGIDQEEHVTSSPLDTSRFFHFEIVQSLARE
ncbi:hypothetical protein KL951_005337 [Ogataea haglerorum]|nr:hypothetical protein KL951_005337 [Ogataea haglerorum]